VSTTLRLVPSPPPRSARPTPAERAADDAYEAHEGLTLAIRVALRRAQEQRDPDQLEGHALEIGMLMRGRDAAFRLMERAEADIARSSRRAGVSK